MFSREDPSPQRERTLTALSLGKVCDFVTHPTGRENIHHIAFAGEYKNALPWIPREFPSLPQRKRRQNDHLAP
jgi:hypothetical protein